MRDQTPVAVIAELEGLEEDYARKACRRLAAEHGIEFEPVKVKDDDLPPGMTEASRRFRLNLAGMLHAYREQPGRHQLEVCAATGLTQLSQRRAIERPNPHNWNIAQLERLADATDQDFSNLMLRALLTPEQYQKVSRCLNS